ncbi:unnamed protein product [Lactuca virosa]|uniref:Uncharacterized protein n=1 Tax=Lactuca virosa TaxID=75947 RepID=A0AAU9PV69_9ASTR|nr:unnamed protein product [Lactuca virosa]
MLQPGSTRVQVTFVKSLQFSFEPPHQKGLIFMNLQVKSWAKNTPGKGATMSRQKSRSGRALEASLSSSPSLKGKRDVMAKH